MESKCQNEDSTCASKESQTGVLPIVLSVKDGNKSVKGKKSKSFKFSNSCDKLESLESAKSAGSSSLGVSLVSEVTNTVQGDQLTENTGSNPSGSVKSADSSLLHISNTKVLDTVEQKEIVNEVLVTMFIK